MFSSEKKETMEDFQKSNSLSEICVDEAVHQLPSSQYNYDIGQYSSRIKNLSEQEKHLLIKNVWEPATDFKFPSTVMSSRSESCKLKWISDYDGLCYSPSKDALFCLPCVLFANAEIDLWENLWLKTKQQLPETVEDTLAIVTPSLYPNIYKVLHLLAVLPVTTCSCESSISTLRRVKTYLRNTMIQVLLLLQLCS